MTGHPRARREVHLVDLTSIAGATYSPTLGYLQAAAAADPEVSAGCTFRRHAVLSRGPWFERACEQVLAALHDPLVVAFTVYFWNRAQSLELARRIRRRWPACRIVVGGNDVSHQQDALFAEAPWVDVLVHGEGELRFVELLRSFLHDDEGLASIDGITYWSGTGADRRPFSTRPAARIVDLATVPSPLSVYADTELSGTTLLVYETNRGCPYSCAFCYWGGATNSKVRQFPMERVAADLERAVRLAGPNMMLALADANFGILPRDVEIARMLVDLCDRHGKKVDFFVTWAKNSNKRILEMAALLRDGGLLAPVTLSTQSFSPTVLDLAQRSNIRLDNFRRLQSEFRDLGIPTYTDLIWGMPGETYESFLAGVEETLAAGGSPVIFPLLLLNNTDYTRERFRHEQQLVVRDLPFDVSDPELRGDVVVAHATMTEADWLRGLEFRLCLHIFQKSLLRCTLRTLAGDTGVRMVELCDHLRDFLFDHVTDGVTHAIAQNYRAAWTDPDTLDQALLQNELGLEVGNGDLYGRQEIHYEAILHRLVENPARLAHFLDAAVDHLLSRIPGDSLPSRTDLQPVIDLDLAAGSVFRSMITGRAEHSDFRVPADILAVLREAGDIPPDLHCPLGAELTGRVTTPAKLLHDHRPNFSFSRYVVLCWRGMVSTLRDAEFQCTATRPAVETVPVPHLLTAAGRKSTERMRG
ncbi:B12-binding domain-containing radical SAM protein [Streptomyces luteolus]|uniref:Radical SAM protein n=1 Tax=Streptomyces luteolus TaxID=3043615 RepID=A0ABT6SW01_9ACTN|nr:radical SAM protein [Streptomyces sp. B-S-A12]MDI3419570.1 radical SAM protein [Streptomyces sp. B-S-A12]